MSLPERKTMYDVEMAAYLVVVHTRDINEYFPFWEQAVKEANRLSVMFPEFKVGIYQLVTSFESMH